MAPAQGTVWLSGHRSAKLHRHIQSVASRMGGDMGADMRGKGQGHSHALAGGEARHAATSADSPRAPSVGGWSPSAWAQVRINPATSHSGGQLLCAARRSSNSRSRMLGKRICGLAMGNTPSRCVMGYYSTAGRLGTWGG